MTAPSFSLVNNQSYLDAALTYADMGLRVFPCRPGAKTPMVRWSEAATTDKAIIMDWWLAQPDANIGLAMGNGWHALDLDRKAGQDGWLSYLELGGLRSQPPWPVQMTPSGGMHFLWSLPGVSFRNFTKRGLFGGLDMRSDRGYILGAPSVVDGKRYRWIDGNPDAPIPGPLLEACFNWSPPESTTESIKVTPESMDPWEVDHWVEVLELGAGEGTGDWSRDGYRKAKQAFAMGLTLEQMATVYPASWLATIGEREPHRPGGGLAWGWKYVVCSAWRDREAAGALFEKLEKESPAGGAGQAQEISDEGGSENQEGDLGSGESIDDLYLLVKGRVEGLTDGDTLGAQRMIAQVLGCGFDEFREAGLWRDLKQSSGMSVESIRAEARRQRALVKDERTKGKETRDDPKAPVYVKAQDKVLVPGEGMISRHAFVTSRAREHQGSREKADEYWLTGTNARAEQVHDLTYDPALEPGVVSRDDGVRVYNLYTPPALEARGDGSEASVRPWLDLLDSLQLEEGEVGREALLDWAAAVVQYPEKKINHGVLFGGAPGIGKDSWLDPVLDCVGRQNVKTIGGDDLIKNFSGWQADAKLVVINEIDYGDHKDRRQVTERLKRVLASPPRTLRVDDKHIRPYEIPNRIQAFAMTNHRGCIESQKGERRWLALWCSRKAAEDMSLDMVERWNRWFAGYYEWLEKGGRSAVMAYLRARVIDIRRIVGSPPMRTGWLMDLQEQSDDPLTLWIRDHTEGRVGLLGLDTVQADELQAWLDTGVALHWGVKGAVSNRRLAVALTAAGWTKRRLGGNYQKQRRWVRPDLGDGREAGLGAPDASIDSIQARKILRFPEQRRKAVERPTYDWL